MNGQWLIIVIRYETTGVTPTNPPIDPEPLGFRIPYGGLS